MEEGGERSSEKCMEFDGPLGRCSLEDEEFRSFSATQWGSVLLGLPEVLSQKTKASRSQDFSETVGWDLK